MMAINEEQIQQRGEWRLRLIKAAIGREHSNDTLVDMLVAGLQQAYIEGVLDCAEMCDVIATRTTAARDRFVAATLANSMREYSALNARDPNG